MVRVSELDLTESVKQIVYSELYARWANLMNEIDPSKQKLKRRQNKKYIKKTRGMNYRKQELEIPKIHTYD